jgi:hypothetical protein
MNQFAERYKTLSNADLLKIIDNPVDYKHVAIVAAETELANRDLSEDQLANAAAENDAINQEVLRRREKKRVFKDKVNDISNSIIDTVHPIQQAPPSTNKIITLLSLVFGGMFLVVFFNQLSLIVIMLTGRYKMWVFSLFFYILPIILIGIATFLFWRRKKSGWRLFCIYCTWSGFSGLVFCIVILCRHWNSRGIDYISSPALPASTIWALLFFGGCLWLIFKNDIREVYNIDKQTMLTAIAIGAIGSALTIFILVNS